MKLIVICNFNNYIFGLNFFKPVDSYFLLSHHYKSNINLRHGKIGNYETGLNKYNPQINLLTNDHNTGTVTISYLSSFFIYFYFILFMFTLCIHLQNSYTFRLRSHLFSFFLFIYLLSSVVLFLAVN